MFTKNVELNCCFYPSTVTSTFSSLRYLKNRNTLKYTSKNKIYWWKVKTDPFIVFEFNVEIETIILLKCSFYHKVSYEKPNRQRPPSRMKFLPNFTINVDARYTDFLKLVRILSRNITIYPTPRVSTSQINLRSVFWSLGDYEVKKGVLPQHGHSLLKETRVIN